MTEVNRDLMSRFLRGRHLNLSLILVVHNLYFKSAFTRTLILNSHYIVLFRNSADTLQVETLGRRMFPYKNKLFVKAFLRATALPYGYLLIDAKTTSWETLRLRAQVLLENADNFERVYILIHKMEEYVLIPVDTFNALTEKMKRLTDNPGLSRIEDITIGQKFDVHTPPRSPQNTKKKRTSRVL